KGAPAGHRKCVAVRRRACPCQRRSKSISPRPRAGNASHGELRPTAMRFNRSLLLLPLLGACTTPADQYPSLAIRDAERVTGTLEPAEPAPYVPPETPAAVVTRLDQL